MDDIKKVIDFINDEIAWLTEQKDSTDTIMGEVYKEIDGDERIQIMRNAISAMQELEQYRKLGASPQRCAELISERSAAKRILAHYETIGTLEECREAMEKQQAVPPKKAFLFEGKQAEIADYNGITNFDTYRCPECGRIVAERTVVKSVFPDGFIKYKYCKDCGRKLDWGENDGYGKNDAG